jgi:multiple sugar transport system ATP-binding protein
MRVEIANLHKRLSNTMIYVTHDQVEAMTLADKIVVLRAGRVEQVGSPLKLYNHPANRFVAGFIGSPKMNFLDLAPPADVLSRPRLGPREVHLPFKVLSGQQGVTFSIRPEHLRISAGGVDLGEARVQLVEQLGSASLVYGHLQDGQPVTLQLDGQRRILPGEGLLLSCDAADCHFFHGIGAAFPHAASMTQGTEHAV